MGSSRQAETRTQSLPAIREGILDADPRLIERVQRVSLELGLSARESQVALALVHDLNADAIGDCLGVSPHTVQSYVKRLYRKANVRSRHALVRRVLQPK